MEKFDSNDGDSSLLENCNFENVLELNNEEGQIIKDGMNFLSKELSYTFV